MDINVTVTIAIYNPQKPVKCKVCKNHPWWWTGNTEPSEPPMILKLMGEKVLQLLTVWKPSLRNVLSQTILFHFRFSWVLLPSSHRLTDKKLCFKTKWLGSLSPLCSDSGPDFKPQQFKCPETISMSLLKQDLYWRGVHFKPRRGGIWSAFAATTWTFTDTGIKPAWMLEYCCGILL